MALLFVTAATEDLGYLTGQQKSSGDLKFYVYVSVIDSDGKPVSDLVKHNFGLVMFDGIETVRLDSEWEVNSAVNGRVVVEHGFYGLEIDRALSRNEAVLPEARLFGLTVHRGEDRGQTIFKLSYRKQ
jgi:hypothetical protein